VPQVLRPELLHLLRLNFVPDSMDEFSIEADVLFAPFCEDIGNGYYRFGDNARLLLLRGLDPAYAHEPTPRSVQTAKFLASFINQQTRNMGPDYDQLYIDYLEVERWSALGFLDPDLAAQQLATALQCAAAPHDIAARMRIGGVASTLSTPLARYGRLLAYAAGLEALHAGETVRARNLLEPLGDSELEIGSVRLTSPQALLKQKSQEPGDSESESDEEDLLAAVGKRIYISYRRQDSADVTGRIYDQLIQQFGREAVFKDVDSIPVGVDFRTYLDAQVAKCHVFLAVIGPDENNGRQGPVQVGGPKGFRPH
jgi:hypothetical protein